MLEDVDLLVCGAGPAGCVLAERAASVLGWNVLVVDRRPHLAGNCRDSQHSTGILVHDYGPHYFRTNDIALVRYLSRFTDWIPGNYVVKASVGGKLYPFPINLTTLEKFFGRSLTPESAHRLLEKLRVPIDDPANSEEWVLSRVGRELYEAFYLNYTRKQWRMPPSELAASVCGRVPVRLNRDERYAEEKFQLMPARGFTALFARMLDHPRIQMLLGCDFRAIRRQFAPRQATAYTGPIDEYFDNRFGRLPYRSLRFQLVPFATEYRQPCVQINYPNEFDYTRSIEYKHVTGQRHPATVVSYEIPTAHGEPLYPVPTSASAALYGRYRNLAEHATRSERVYFCGRLAQYRYFNTDEVIQEALQCFETIRQRCQPRRQSA